MSGDDVVVSKDECDFCNNVIDNSAIMKFCVECRKYMNNKMRRRLLDKALKKYGLSIRDDSIMAKKYIRGDEDTPLDLVVDTTLEMNFYIKFTEYRLFIKEFIASFCLNNGLPIGMKIEDKEVMNNIRHRAKSWALDKFIRGGGDIDLVAPSLRDVGEIMLLEAHEEI